MISTYPIKTGKYITSTNYKVWNKTDVFCPNKMLVGST